MTRRSMMTAPMDGTRILVEYHPVYYRRGEWVPSEGTVIQEVYWSDKDNWSRAGWREWLGEKTMQSTGSIPSPLGWWPRPDAAPVQPTASVEAVAVGWAGRTHPARPDV